MRSSASTASRPPRRLLKAVLAGHGIEFPRTHSLRFLIDLLADHGLAPAARLHGVTELYPSEFSSGTKRRSMRNLLTDRR
jgi:HEPN domain